MGAPLPTAPISKTPSRSASLAVCTVLTALILIVFGQTLRHGFLNYDDTFFVTDNPRILKGITLENIRWTLTAGLRAGDHNTTYSWWPLTLLSHMTDVSLFGLRAGWHHAVSVLLHAAAASCLFLALRAMTATLWRSAFVAAVFAVHPLHVESVAWIAERKDVLSGLFFMLTLLAYARYARNPFSLGNLLLVTGCFLLGLLSKPMLVTLPFVLLLLDFWPMGRLSRKNLPRLLLEKLPLFALSGLCSAVTLLVQRETAMNTLASLPLVDRFVNALCGYGFYLQKTLWPEGLALLYPLSAAHPSLWQPVAWLLLLAGVTVAVLLLRRTRPYLLTGWFWFLGMLFPVIGLFQTGEQAYADRYSYLPQTGLVIALTWLAADWAGVIPRRKLLLAAGGGAAVVALALAAARQVSFWKTSTTLWNRSIACTGANATAHANLGTALIADGRPEEEALREFRRSLEIDPNSLEAHINLSNVLLRLGRTEEALLHCQAALQIGPNSPTALNNLAWAYYLQGKPELAIPLLERSLELDPRQPLPFKDLGRLLLQQGRAGEAAARFRQALALKTDFPEARYHLGVALANSGDLPGALAQLELAVQGDPSNILYRNLLSSGLLSCPDPSLRNPGRALDLARETTQLTGGQDPATLRTLAAAQAATGDASAALATAKEALALAEQQGNAPLAGQIRKDLQRYRETKP